MLFRGREAHGVGKTPSRAQFEQFVRAHAAFVTDEVFRARVNLFEAASTDPQRLWRGEFGALPGAGCDDSYSYFDHLIANGSISVVVAYLNRQRLKDRVSELRTMRTSGDLRYFIRLAETMCPGIDDHDAVSLARLLLDAELRVLTQIDVVSASSEALAAPIVPRLESDDHAVNSLASATRGIAVDPLSLDELFALWQREARPSASTLSTWGGHSQNLKNFLGVKAYDLASVTQQDMVRWKDRLVQDGKAASTISRSYFGFARAMFRFAVMNRRLLADPSEGIKVAGKAKAGTRMLPYTNDEMSRLLRHAETAQTAVKHWLLPLAAATGARIGELAQLHGAQIGTLDGMAVVHIKPAADGGSIKNVMSERTVPLHKALLIAGFFDFVAERGNGPLFYDRTSGDPTRKHASKSVTNRLAAWVRDLGFRDPRKAPNHAIRHWFKTECARLKIEDSIVDAIQGHYDATSASAYRHISVEMMSEAINRLQFPPES